MCSLSAHAVPQPLDSAHSPKTPSLAQAKNLAGMTPGNTNQLMKAKDSLDSLDTVDEEDHAPPPAQKYCLCVDPGQSQADTAATNKVCGGYSNNINNSRKGPTGATFTSVSPHLVPNRLSRCRC